MSIKKPAARNSIHEKGTYLPPSEGRKFRYGVEAFIPSWANNEYIKKIHKNTYLPKN